MHKKWSILFLLLAVTLLVYLVGSGYLNPRQVELAGQGQIQQPARDQSAY